MAAPTSPWQTVQRIEEGQNGYDSDHTPNNIDEFVTARGLFPPVQLRSVSKDGADAGIPSGTVMVTGLPVRGSNRVMVIRTSPKLQLAPELKQCGTLRGREVSPEGLTAAFG